VIIETIRATRTIAIHTSVTARSRPGNDEPLRGPGQSRFLPDRRKRGVTERVEDRKGEHRGGGRGDEDANAEAVQVPAALPRDPFGEDEHAESELRGEVRPRRALRSGVEQTAGCEQVRERQEVESLRRGRDAVGEREERQLEVAFDPVLHEEQHGGEDHREQRRSDNGRNEGRNLADRRLRERDREGEEREQRERDDDRAPPVVAGRGSRRNVLDRPSLERPHAATIPQRAGSWQG
jgi:hypothetical protein